MLPYHGADHTADVDAVTASRNIISWVSTVFEVTVQYFKANFHHVVLKLGRQREYLNVKKHHLPYGSKVI